MSTGGGDDGKSDNIVDSKKITVEDESAAAPDAEKVLFACALCGLTELCDYYGSSPPFTRPIAFKEDVYVMKDPFSAGGRDRPSTAYLLLGANCCICGATVCSDLQTNCSIFYYRRFCFRCAIGNVHSFPDEIQRELMKSAATATMTNDNLQQSTLSSASTSTIVVHELDERE